jgi:Tol biopolymer transport system component
VVDLGQGDAKLLQENATQPAFSPGGQELLFRNLDPLRLGLGILDLATGEVSELTTHAEDSAPSWSAEINQVVFASNKGGDRQWRIFAISPGEVRGEGEEWTFGQMPAWSHDGIRIAYHGCDEKGDACGVWTMQPGIFAPSRLSSDASDTAPGWSPDGSKVAFTSARDGNWELYWVDVASRKENRLTEHASTDVAPVWSSDGKHLAYLSNRDGSWAVYLLEIESGEMYKVIATGDAYPDPVSERLSWLP